MRILPSIRSATDAHLAFRHSAICDSIIRVLAYAGVLLTAFAASAEDPAPLAFPAVAPPPSQAAKELKIKSEPRDASSTGKVIYKDSTASLSVAMCGLEGYKDSASLDVGLLDFNVPDPARAAGHVADDLKEIGRNRYDYRSSVILGVTLGYHF